MTFTKDHNPYKKKVEPTPFIYFLFESDFDQLNYGVLKEEYKDNKK